MQQDNPVDLTRGFSSHSVPLEPEIFDLIQEGIARVCFQAAHGIQFFDYLVDKRRNRHQLKIR